MRGHASLDSQHFVCPGPCRPRLLPARGLVVSLFAALILAGCARHDTAPPVEDSETSGRISIAAAPDVRALVAAEVRAFRSGYPQAVIDLRDPESSGQVISALLGGHADLAGAGRELEQEERDMARQAGIELEGHRIAKDAMCLVVSDANPVHNVTIGELRRIWTGEFADWARLGGPEGRIVPVLPPLSSDLARAFSQRVMDGASMKAPTVIEVSDSAVASTVARTRGAIGVVPLSLARSAGLRALAVAPLEGLPYVEPDMESVHEGHYPLTRFINLYRRTRGARLAGGFITFVSSQPGQELVLASGRVPTAVPLRFVRRSPLLGSH